MKLILNSEKWFSCGHIHVCGYCYDDAGNLYREKRLCDYFAAVQSPDGFFQSLRAANGLFSVIIEKPGMTLIATDRVRRYPLFYTSDGQITDTPNALVHSLERDNEAFSFYNASGAVLPGHTLLKKIKQLPAASYGIYSFDKWQVQQYADYLCTKKDEKSISLERLDEVMISVFQRLVESIGDRQIVVPLTAGNDSRLILCMLHKMGYHNVVCYTVVGKGGSEWEGANEAARRLNYKHYKVDIYDEEALQLTFADEDKWERYYRYVGSYTNFCWLYDYAALLFLEKKHLIDSDAVFVPGHSADMIGGSHLYKANVQENENAESLVNKIMFINFEYGGSRNVRTTLRDYFNACVNAKYTPYSAYQNWVVQHRQVHNILNSIRVYDFLGYDVRLPFWDSALYEIFSHLPYAELKKSCLYLDYVQSVFSSYGLSVSMQKKQIHWPCVAMKRLLKRVVPAEWINRVHKSDPIGEKLLSRRLDLELTHWLGHPHSCTNSNELMLQWYEMRVLQGRG